MYEGLGVFMKKWLLFVVVTGWVHTEVFASDHDKRRIDIVRKLESSCLRRACLNIVRQDYPEVQFYTNADMTNIENIKLGIQEEDPNYIQCYIKGCLLYFRILMSDDRLDVDFIEKSTPKEKPCIKI